MRGKLPNGRESLLDQTCDQHIAVEFGFMSTSYNKTVCEHYEDKEGESLHPKSYEMHLTCTCTCIRAYMCICVSHRPHLL